MNEEGSTVTSTPDYLRVASTCDDCGDPLAPNEQDSLNVCHPCLDARAFVANWKGAKIKRPCCSACGQSFDPFTGEKPDGR